MLKDARYLVAAISVVLCAFPLPCHSDQKAITGKEFIDIYDKYKNTKSIRDHIEHTIGKIVDGMEWYRIAVAINKYCPPSNIILTETQEMEILRDAIKDEKLANSPFQLAMLFGMIKTFPCK